MAVQPRHDEHAPVASSGRPARSRSARRQAKGRRRSRWASTESRSARSAASASWVATRRGSRSDGSRHCPRTVGRGALGCERLHWKQLVWSGYVRRLDLVVLESLDLADGPQQCLEDRPSTLRDRDPRGFSSPSTSCGRHLDVDDLEGGHPEVLARQARRTAKRRRHPRGPQAQRHDVATHRAPDLPGPVGTRPEMRLVDLLDLRVIAEVCHAFSLAAPQGLSSPTID